METFRHYLLARHQSALNNHIVAKLRSQFDETFLNRRIAAHHIDIGAALFNGNRLLGNRYRTFAHIQQQLHFRKLSRQQDPVRIGHLGANGECTRLRVDLRFGKVYITFIGIDSVISQSNRNIGLPGTGRILTAYLDIAFLAFKVIQCGHTEVHQYGIALHHGSEQRFGSRTYQCSQVHVSFTDMSRQGGTHDCIPQFQFRLIQISLAHGNGSLGGFISGLRIIQIQLAGGILRIQRANTLQVTFGLQRLRLVFLQLRAGLISLCTVLVLIDDKQDLILCYILTFGEKHTLQVSLYARTNFYKLLRANTAYIFAKNFHITNFGRLHNHSGRFRLNFLRPGQYQITGKQYRHTGYHHYYPFLSQL